MGQQLRLQRRVPVMLVIRKRRVRVHGMVLRLLDVVYAGAEALDVVQARLYACFELGAPGLGHAVRCVEGLEFEFRGRVRHEGVLDGVSAGLAWVAGVEADVVRRVPI